MQRLYLQKEKKENATELAEMVGLYMDIQIIKLKEIKLTKYNPRKKLNKMDEAYKRIKASVEEFGYVDPIIVNIRNMHLVGGEQRYLVLTELKYEEAECVCVDLNDKQEKKLNIALNKISGYWDNTKLEELFNELKLSEEELFTTGFSENEIEALKTDFIADLLEDDFTTVNRELDKFAITFNIPKEHEVKFNDYIKKRRKRLSNKFDDK